MHRLVLRQTPQALHMLILRIYAQGLLGLVLVLFFCLSSFAQDENSTTQDGATPTEQSFFANVAEIPDKVFKNQVFSVKYKVISLVGGDIKYSLSESSGVSVLSHEAKWKNDGNNTYSLTLFFKATATQVVLPDVTISIDNVSVTLPSQTIMAENAQNSPYSCGVIADKLKVNSARIDSYDAANNIVLLDIVAQNANLTDFHFPISGQQGVTQINQNYPNGQLFYFVTAPNTQNVLEFQYFNAKTSSLETVSVPLDLQKVKDLVSTQTDLQPKAKDKAIYVFIVVLILGAILYAIYYFKRDKIFLVLIAVTLLIGAAFLFWPNKVVIVKKDCVAYLLPTESSTPFYKTSADIEVELLKRTDGFSKIEFESGRIGWIKDECVAQ